jgi:hypothetical protein
MTYIDTADIIGIIIIASTIPAVKTSSPKGALAKIDI